MSDKIQTNSAKATELTSSLKSNVSELDFTLKSPSYSESSAVKDLKGAIKGLDQVFKTFQENNEVDIANLLKIHETLEKEDIRLAGKGGN